MLTLFKSKPILKDLIPDNYIDIHSHLLPGIDDGAKNLDDSLRLIKALQGFGAKQFVTTPHIIQYFYDNDFQSIKSTEEVFHKNLEQNNISIPVRAAAEYMMDESFVKLFQSGELLTLKDNYVLVEMSYLNPPIQLYSIIFELQVAGYIPILAHPERYTFYHNNLDEYKKLINAGCLFQLNLLSVVGYYGAAIARIADYLLKNGMYNFVGSDVHHDNHIAAFEKKIIIKDTKPLIEIINNNQFFKIV
jgi:tyrosine-protein phosphatase YwqE